MAIVVVLDNTTETNPDRIPSCRYNGSSAGERNSNTGIVNAGSEPRPACDITDANTALSITIEVVFVSEGDKSADDGHKTDSTAKKHPATGALKPEEIPAADPVATRDNLVPLLQCNTFPIPCAIDEPISTLGPSGPSELPVPRVTVAATAFRNDLHKLVSKQPVAIFVQGAAPATMRHLELESHPKICHVFHAPFHLEQELENLIEMPSAEAEFEAAVLE
jgi:hypothetical protein